jgi:hypothetical protein
VKILIIVGAILDSALSVTEDICARIVKRGMREKTKFSNLAWNARPTIYIGCESVL